MGMILVFMFGMISLLPVWITPKFSFDYPNGKGAFGAGTILYSTLGGNDPGIGLLYGVNTFGTPERQITVDAGYAYNTKNGFADYPTFSLSGIARTGKKWALILENYFISTGNEPIGIISGGARYIGSSIALDFAGIVPLNTLSKVFIMIPWLSITVLFKSAKILSYLFICIRHEQPLKSKATHVFRVIVEFF